MSRGCLVLLILVLVVIAGSCGLNSYVERLDPTLEKAPPFPARELAQEAPGIIGGMLGDMFDAPFMDESGQGGWAVVCLGIVICLAVYAYSKMSGKGWFD